MNEWVWLATLGVVLSACGDDGGERADPETTSSAPATESGGPAGETGETGETDLAAAAVPEPTTPPIDLLHGVATDLATSTAYRDDAGQVAKLVDGDLETAWNSQSDDLAGAWIDVRVPDGATVASIAMTVGYTKRTPARDLFTANQRIGKVRVLRDGDELVVHELDIDSRELQSIPVTGGGGVYRIELVELTVGEREDWREACVSELRVMGRAADAQEGARLPRFAVGALPEPLGEGGPADRDAVKALGHRRVAWFAERWQGYAYALYGYERDAEVGEVDPAEERELRRERREALEKVIEVVAPVDAAAADAVRVALLGDDGGLAAASHAFHVTADWLGDDAERCWYAKTLAKIRLDNVLRGLRREAEIGDMDDFEAMEVGDEPPGGPDFYELADRVDDIARNWDRNGRGGATHLGQITMPRVAAATQAEWDALNAELAIARPACGWE